MPSTTSSSVSSALASSTVMTPSLPTRCMAPAIILPIDASPLADTVPTCATSADELTLRARRSMSLITAPTAMSTPRLTSIGFMPAATDLAPSRTIACASTVAVVVPSPARSEVFCATSRTICAPMFSNLSSSSISLATVTPSLVIRGAPNDLSSTTFRPFGPSVTRTAWVRMSTPRSILSRASTENFTSFAAMSLLLKSLFVWPLCVSSSLRSAKSGSMPSVRRRGVMGVKGSGGFAASFGLHQHPHEVAFLHDQVLDAVELDFGPRPFSEEHPVAHLDVDGDELAGLVASARAYGDDFALLRFFLGRVWNDDAACRLLLGLDALDDDAVVKWTEFHDLPPNPMSFLGFFVGLIAGQGTLADDVTAFSTLSQRVLAETETR